MSKELKAHELFRGDPAAPSNLFSARIPLTFQLFQIFRDRILRGEIAAGERLPPEVELAKDFRVSVITVQRAMRDLSAAGLITRHRRRGTFVTNSRAALVQPQHSDALSLIFSDEFGSDTKVIVREFVTRPEHLALTFPQHERLLYIRRVVFRGGSPWSYASIYLLPEYANGITLPMIKRYPMFRLLREKLGLSFNNVRISLQARSAGVDVANSLQINSLAPVTVLNAVLFDADARAVNALEINYRGDRFVFRLDMDLRVIAK
jgi:GntR family transcriptional regulator